MFVDHIGDFPIPEDVMAVLENSGIFKMSVDDEVVSGGTGYFKTGSCQEHLYLLISTFVYDYCQKADIAHAICNDKFLDAAVRYMWNQIKNKEIKVFDNWGGTDKGGVFLKSIAICTKPFVLNGEWRREILTYNGIHGEACAAELFQNIHYIDEITHQTRKTYYFSWLKKDESYENKTIGGFTTEKKNGYVITEYPLGDDVEFFRFPDEIMALI